MWFRERRARYPWRVGPDPYRVLVSEVMLQQTQAARVAPAFERFVWRFPTVQALASASRGDVIRAWAGLGYNRRAVALHGAARAILREHGGRIPPERDALLGLPGVGPYTAAAVTALAYGRPVAAVDTNVRRVVARAALGLDPSEAGTVAVSRAAQDWLDRQDPGGWNQAVMDLGREVCRPAPRCESCPLVRICLFAKSGEATRRGGAQQGRFAGSFRQLRGAVIAELRTRPSARLDTLSRIARSSLERTAEAVRSLARDGLLQADPAAISVLPAGRVRLADGD